MANEHGDNSVISRLEHPCLTDQSIGSSSSTVAIVGVAASLCPETHGEAAPPEEDVNVGGLLNGLDAALPVFRRQGHSRVVTTVSTAGITISPTMAVYPATKNAARTIMEGLRAESTDGVIRTTSISPGFVRTELADEMAPGSRDEIQAGMRSFGLDPKAVANTIYLALKQPHDVEIGDLTIRPTVQG